MKILCTLNITIAASFILLSVFYKAGWAKLLFWQIQQILMLITQNVALLFSGIILGRVYGARRPICRKFSAALPFVPTWAPRQPENAPCKEKSRCLPNKISSNRKLCMKNCEIKKKLKENNQFQEKKKKYTIFFAGWKNLFKA